MVKMNYNWNLKKKLEYRNVLYYEVVFLKIFVFGGRCGGI